MTVSAKYENGVFKPLEDVRIEEGTVVEVSVPAAGNRRNRSLRELGAFGMWADNDDIADGVTYVDRLRDNPRSQ
jgi:hypothetical protein